MRRGARGAPGSVVAHEVAHPAGTDDGRVGLHPTGRGEDDPDIKMGVVPQGDAREPEVGGTPAWGTVDTTPDGAGTTPDEQEGPALDVGPNRPVVEAEAPLKFGAHEPSLQSPGGPEGVGSECCGHSAAASGASGRIAIVRATLNSGDGRWLARLIPRNTS